MTKGTRIALGLALAVALGLAALLMGGLDLTPQISAEPQVPAGAADPTGPVGAQTFRTIAERQMPTVVNIRTESRRQTRQLTGYFEGDELLQRFFGLPPRAPAPRDHITEGAGSGFIIEGGLILTNNHVVAGATKIAVALYADKAGEEYDARVVGRDPLTDSALIELTEKPNHQLPVARLGKSSDVRPGDWVMAIGNPFNLAHTVTVGVISAVARPFPVSENRWQDVLQTDAAINPGNSGGPLLNLNGDVVGINTAILSRGPMAGNVGVGFAIPIDSVRELLPELRHGTITRGRIGVQIAPVTEDMAKPLGLTQARGALVRLVERGGPAAEAGLQAGDVIVTYNGEPVESSEQLVQMVTRTKPGAKVPIEVARNRQFTTINVTIGTLELEDVAAEPGASTETGTGMALQELTPQIRSQLDLPAGRGAALVAGVQPASAAARAGIQPGDVILEVNQKPVKSLSEAAAALRDSTGDAVFVLVWRQGQEVFVPIARR